MDDLGTALLLLLVAAAVLAVAWRLRRTPTLGGSIRLKDEAGDKLSIDALLAKELASSGAGTPLISISTVTKQTGTGDPVSTEVITIDGQTYHSVDEIPPEVRDRIRRRLSAAPLKSSGKPMASSDALLRIQGDLARLGLDLTEPRAERDAASGDSSSPE